MKRLRACVSCIALTPSPFCSEQKQGLENITSSLLEIDQVTQQTFSQAESMEEAAEQLQFQTQQLQQSVYSLQVLIDGANSTNEENKVYLDQTK